MHRKVSARSLQALLPRAGSWHPRVRPVADGAGLFFSTDTCRRGSLDVRNRKSFFFFATFLLLFAASIEVSQPAEGAPCRRSS